MSDRRRVRLLLSFQRRERLSHCLWCRGQNDSSCEKLLAYLATLQRAFGDASKVVSLLQLSCFTTLHRLLQFQVLPTYMVDNKVAATPIVDHMMQAAVMQLQREYPPEEVFEKLDGGIGGC